MSYDQALLFRAIRTSLGRNPSLSLISVSQELRVGRRTIQTNVRMVTGKTFREFRDETLINRFRNLLIARPTLAIKEISLEVGYACPQSFARAVKRACGLSPEEFRSNIAQEVLLGEYVGDLVT